MPRKKLTYESLIASKEYMLWEDLNRVAIEYDISETNLFAKEDLSGIYWEPFFERLYKLGQIMKFTKKLKEIRIDWMRPILYFGARSDGIIEFDGRHDIVDKGAVGDCSVVKYCFKSTISAIRSITDIDEKNFKDIYKAFKKEIKYFFNALNKYVRDGGFYLMHQHVKLILKPLLDLRRAGYRLFSVEKAEENYYDLTFFNDTESLKTFMESTRDFFTWEKFIRSRDKDEEKLKEFMKRETNQNLLQYNFRNEIRKVERPSSVNPYSTNINFYKHDKEEEKPKEKEKKGTHSKKKMSQRERDEKIRKEKERRNLLYPNIEDLNQPEPSKLKKAAYQVQFEKGLEEMIEYLNDKRGKDFPYMIDTHKIFVNINHIPDGTKKEASNFYLSQLNFEIDNLKQKCYEMKLNGITRVLMPITKNTEIIEVIKSIFDLHNIIDNIMGNYLLYDQYMFIYDALKFITNSTASEQFEILKNRDYMEECIPRYIIFLFMCHSAEILNKMRDYYKEHVGRPFKFEDSYQISQHELLKEDNDLIFAYEIYGPYQRFFTEEIMEKKKKYDEEVKKFGRFWIMEGFFKSEDKDLWLEAIDLLSTINPLVREDIRDSFICGKKQDFIQDNQNQSQNENEKNTNSSKNNSYSELNISNTSKNQNESITQNQIQSKKSKSKLTPLTKRKSSSKMMSRQARKRRSSRKHSGLSSFESQKLPKDINNLRPPSVWNFPIYRIEKLYIDGGKKEIRNVEPSVCYKDGRVDKFRKLFENLYKEMVLYFQTAKADLWDYFFNKTLKALRISYVTNKELKAEEELRKQIEEEIRKKEEEELKQEKEREKELERLKIRKKDEGELPQETIEDPKNKGKDNKKGNIQGKENSRINSAKPNKENDKNNNKNRINSAKPKLDKKPSKKLNAVKK